MEDYNFAKISVRNPSSRDVTVIAGFLGAGLVGTLAVQYLIDNKSFEHIGDMSCQFLQPGSLSVNGVAKAPIRFYESGNIIAVLSDIPVPDDAAYLVSSAIMDWLTVRCNISEIVLVGGIITGGFGERVFGVSTTEEGFEKIKDKCIILPNLNITGITGAFVNEGILRDIPVCAYVVESDFDIDPRASAAGLDVISSIYGFTIDTQGLVEQAQMIEPIFRKMSRDFKDSKSKPMSYDDVMYV
ncbi:MAG TPA: PAC2 family protein [Methanocorpusculum sp.]|nr:PAC2 family protein [Methanocorpusculum sp.]